MPDIFLSAGHELRKPGACARHNGVSYVEATEAVLLRDAVAAECRLRGKIVFEDSINDGANAPLRDAIALAKKVKGKRAEIHFNGVEDAAANGIEVLCKPNPADIQIAQKIAGGIHKATGLKLRGDKGYRPSNSGQHDRLAFIEQANGFIIEICFITNRNDIETYKKNFKAVVNALADVFMTL
jgi:N-acetylmuramoyl-L-alanine amidase